MKKKTDKKMDVNYLDLIPVRTQGLRWHKDIKDRVILEVENTGSFQ